MHAYNAIRIADIRKYAAHHGPKAAARHFLNVCGHKVSEFTARTFSDAYFVELKSQASTLGWVVSVNSLPTKTRKRLLLLGDLGCYMVACRLSP